MAKSAFNSEPIFWTTTQPHYNTADRERTKVIGGKKVREKFPQTGHVGSYDDKEKARGVRFLLMVRHDGHAVFHCLTNGAAHMDHTTPYGQYALRKARYLGWFTPGECPCALVSTGEINGETLVDQSIRSSNPCAPGSYSGQKPCKHALDEIHARREQNTAIQEEREASSKTKDDKMLEMQREMTDALIKATVKQHGGEIVDAPPVGPPPVRRGKKDDE